MIGVPQSTSLVVNLKLFLTGTTTPATGKTLTITASKNGSAFGNLNVGASPTVTELSNGWYKVTADTTDTNTLGDLIVAGAASGCDTAERIYRVVLATNAGLTALPNTACTSNTSLITSGSGTDQISLSAGLVKASTTSTVSANVLRFGTALVQMDMSNNVPIMSCGSWTDFNAAIVASVVVDGNNLPGVNLVDWAGSAPAALSVSGSLVADVRYVAGVLAPNDGNGRLKVYIDQIAGQTAVAIAPVTFPGVIASATNITAGTITTVTNLTNAPTVGDFTSTMKTSLNAATPAVTVSDKTGFSLSSAGIQAIWDALTSALTTVGSIGKLLVTNIDAAISGRMATYTQPSGFLTTTFPSGTVANTTNITAGTITTVTNLTNAPTNGDLTAAMKASVTAAIPPFIVSGFTDGTTTIPVTINGASHLPNVNVGSYAGDNSINTNGGGLPNVAATATVDFDDLLTTVVDGALTFQDVLKLVGAALAGKNTGAGTTSFVFRNPGDTKNRISATLDTNGNRVSLTYDLT